MIKRFATLLLTFVVAFSGMVLVNTESAYAASKPAKVTGLEVSSKTESNITVQWKAAKRSKKYQLAYHVEGGGWKYKTLKTRKYTLSELDAYSHWYFRVRGINGSRKGSWSSTVNVYTNPDNPPYDYLPEIVNLRTTRIGPGSFCIAWDVHEAEPPEEEITNEPEETGGESEGENTEPEQGTEQTQEGEAAGEPEVQETAGPVTDALGSEEALALDAEEPAAPEQELLDESVEGEPASEETVPEEEEEWQPFEAYKYRVQIKNSDGTWKTLTSSLDKDTKTYRIGELAMGAESTVRVVAIDTVTWNNYTVVNADGYSDELSCTTNVIPGLSIKKSYTTRNKIYKEKRTLNVKGLMLHSVGDDIQSAETWYNIYNRKGYNAAAVHAFIDGTDGMVWQTMPWGQRAGHAGKKANDSYIGVEMCESKYIRYTSGTKFTIASKYRSNAQNCADTTYWAAVRLFAYLCDSYNLDPVKPGVIYSHNEWRIKTGWGHWDPEHYWKGLSTGYTMNQFRKDVKNVLDESITVTE